MLLLMVTAPVLLVVLVVGLVVSIFQAATQINEATLTFVPKIVAILLAMILTGPFVGAQISAFSSVVFERIQTGF